MTCPHCQATLPEGSRFCGACGKTFEIAGRYRLVAKLGQGGMGTVYRAEQISLKRNVALKILDPNLFQDRDLVRRFHTEAELAAKLSHPHTVTLYDFGESDGLLFIAMELLEGRSLRDVIARDGALPPARSVDIAEQVASSLSDAHAHGIVHRDLKPDNVMLQDRAGRRDFVRVLDFGIAKLRDERAGGASVMQHTMAGELIGTPAYMAPEQVNGARVDGRTDVYALGVMLYEMLAGRPPFEAPNVLTLLAMQINDTPEPPERKRPGLVIPAGLTSFVMRCLAKRPGERPPNMETVIAELAGLRAAVGAAPSGVATPRPHPSPPGTPMGVPMMAPATRMPLSGAAPTPVGAQPPPLAMPAPLMARPSPPLAVASPLPPLGAPPQPFGAPHPAHPWPRGPAVGAPPRAPAPRKGSLLWLWLTLAGVAAAGIVVVVLLLGRPRAHHDPFDDLNRAIGRLQDAGIATAPDERGIPGLPRPATASSSRYRSTGEFDYWIDPPAGIELRETSPGHAVGTGLVDGRNARIETEAVAIDGSSVTLAMLSEGADAIPREANGTLVEKRTRQIRDEKHVSVIYDVAAMGMRVEAVIYVRPNALIVIYFGVPPDAFERTVSLRDDLFVRGVGFGGSSPGSTTGGFGPEK